VTLPPTTLIRNAYVMTLDAERRVFTDGYVAFTGDRISAVGPMAECPMHAIETVDARGRTVMPGIANAHNHLIQVAFRGYNDDRWPVLDIPKAVMALLGQLHAVGDRLDGERAHALVRLHLLELTQAGYTATHDEHFTNVRKDSADGSWTAVEESGLRGFLARCIVSDRVPERGRETIGAGLAEVERLQARYASDRLRVVPGILNYSFFADPEDMRAIGEHARAANVPLDVDMTDNSRGALLKARGFLGGQVDYYESFGLLENPLYAGKAVNLQPYEYAKLARADGRVALVPMLRMFDGTGLPVHHFLREGMLPAIGTDAPLVTDCQNPFEVMRQVILGQGLRAHRERAEGLPPPAPEHWAVAETAVEMATLGGANTLFLGDCGSLAPGKAADCIIVDTSRAAMQPDQDGRRRVGCLVWAGESAMVDSVFVGGRCLLSGGRSTIWDEDEVIETAAKAMRAIVDEAGLNAMLPTRTAGRSYRGWRYI
jgi:5-methylthioadenosine/S-adenosylhomocysteine deaminase